MQKADECFLSPFIAVAEELNLEIEAPRTKHIRIKCHINTGLCSFVVCCILCAQYLVYLFATSLDVKLATKFIHRDIYLSLRPSFQIALREKSFSHIK